MTDKTTDKTLKNKAIKIKGKDYVLVADRVAYFNDTYKNGYIQTEKLNTDELGRVEFKATVVPDVAQPSRVFTGHSQAVWGDGPVNKTAAMENAETSAIGRALALMGIGVIDSIASADEMNKAIGSTGAKYATEKQIKWLRDTAFEVNDQLVDEADADKMIEEILTIPPQKVPIWKVKDAVDKIKEKPVTPDIVVDLSEDEVAAGVKGLEDGSIPY